MSFKFNPLTGSLDLVGSSGGSGVTTVGSFSGSSQANGASISSTTITFGPADASNPGMVTTGSQTLAGAKTFSTAPVLNSLTASTALALDGSKNVVSSATTGTELGYVSGVTSAIQTQLTGKANTTLSNLGTTSINTNLLFPDNTYSVGGTDANRPTTVWAAQYFGVGHDAGGSRIVYLTASNGNSNPGVILKSASGNQIDFEGIDNVLRVNGTLRVTSHFQTGDSATGSSLGSVVKKLPIYNASGTLLGYIPIYDAIT